MSVNLMDNVMCNELPVLFLLFYGFIIYYSAGVDQHDMLFIGIYVMHKGTFSMHHQFQFNLFI